MIGCARVYTRGVIRCTQAAASEDSASEATYTRVQSGVIGCAQVYTRGVIRCNQAAAAEDSESEATYTRMQSGVIGCDRVCSGVHRSEEHTSELQSPVILVWRHLLQ